MEYPTLFKLIRLSGSHINISIALSVNNLPKLFPIDIDIFTCASSIEHMLPSSVKIVLHISSSIQHKKLHHVQSGLKRSNTILLMVKRQKPELTTSDTKLPFYPTDFVRIHIYVINFIVFLHSLRTLAIDIRASI